MELGLFVHENSLVRPGQNICKISEQVAIGPGLFEEDGFIKSSKLGKIQTAKQNETTIISIKEAISQTKANNSRDLQIKLSDLILARVKKLNENSAKVEILAINNIPVAHFFEGTIKRENMRKTDIDAVKVDEVCQPNDILLCRVKSLNESKNILLSIEADDLGVILSKSENGNILVPVSKERMQSPLSKELHRKKVAKLQEAKFQIS